MPGHFEATLHLAGQLNWFSRSGSTKSPMQSKMSANWRNGVAQKRRHSSAVTSRRCQSWQNAGRIILRDARLRRAPQDEASGRPPAAGSSGW